MEPNCLNCGKQFERSANPRCIVPCSKRHIICFSCIEFMITAPLSEGFRKDCWMFGNLCKVGRPHITCPFPDCGDVFHLKGDDIKGIYKYPETQEDLDRLENERLDMRAALMNNCTLAVSTCIKDVKDMDRYIVEINTICDIVRTTKISTSAVSIKAGIVAVIGAVITAVSGGIAAPVGVPMMIAGGVVSGVSAIGAGAASLTDHFTAKKKIKEASRRLNMRQVELCQLYDMYNEYVVLEAMTAVKLRHPVGVLDDSMSESFQQTASAIKLGIVVGFTGDRIGLAVLRGVSTAVMVSYMFGAVIAGLGVVIDGVTLIVNAKDKANKKDAEQSKAIETLKGNLNQIITQLEDIQKQINLH